MALRRNVFYRRFCTRSGYEFVVEPARVLEKAAVSSGVLCGARSINRICHVVYCACVRSN